MIDEEPDGAFFVDAAHDFSCGAVTGDDDESVLGACVSKKFVEPGVLERFSDGGAWNSEKRCRLSEDFPVAEVRKTDNDWRLFGQFDQTFVGGVDNGAQFSWMLHQAEDFQPEQHGIGDGLSGDAVTLTFRQFG